MTNAKIAKVFFSSILGDVIYFIFIWLLNGMPKEGNRLYGVVISVLIVSLLMLPTLFVIAKNSSKND